MTTEEIANEILNAWYFSQGTPRNNTTGFREVCEVIEKLLPRPIPEDAIYQEQHIGPITDSTALAMGYAPVMQMMPDEIISLLRERMLYCSRVILTPREGYAIDYAKMSNHLAALQAIDELEKMPAVQDASIPF